MITEDMIVQQLVDLTRELVKTNPIYLNTKTKTELTNSIDLLRLLREQRAQQQPPIAAQTYEQIIKELNTKIDLFRSKLFALGAMLNPPCFNCGYTGPGYLQPAMHPCADQHKKLYHREVYPDSCCLDNDNCDRCATSRSAKLDL